MWYSKNFENLAHRINPTGPLMPSDSPALMTKQEFIEYQNPQDKYHGPDCYDFDLERLNINYRVKHLEDYRDTQGGIFRIHTIASSDDAEDGSGVAWGDNYTIRYSDDNYGPFDLVAVIYGGVLYYNQPRLLHRFPTGYRKGRGRQWESAWIPFHITAKKRVKYLQDFVELMEDTRNKNLQRYPHLLQNIRVAGEPYQIRSTQPLVLDKGITIVITNEKGQVVAQASDEWGATLLVVAQEYRKRRLGEILGKLWGDWNPSYPSGGFTSKGLSSAEAIWESRVRELRAKGGYSLLLRQGRITKDRIKQIFAGLTRPARAISLPPSPAQAGEVGSRKIQILIEKDYYKGEEFWGPAFVIYDEAYLDTLDNNYIYGFGFFRGSDSVGTFLYTIDYEKEFRKLATYIALQIARNNREKIYVGPGYGDLLEFEDLEHVRREGDYVYLTEDIVDLEALRLLELRSRAGKDSYDQKYYQLIEAAHSKW